MSGIYYRPDFVGQQLRHLQWYPLAPDGSRADPARPDEWAHFGNFLGWLELQGTSANYRYDQAEATEEGVVLKRLAGTAMMTV